VLSSSRFLSLSETDCCLSQRQISLRAEEQSTPAESGLIGGRTDRPD
jgi:hypothetical protein